MSKQKECQWPDIQTQAQAGSVAVASTARSGRQEEGAEVAATPLDVSSPQLVHAPDPGQPGCAFVWLRYADIARKKSGVRQTVASAPGCL